MRSSRRQFLTIASAGILLTKSSAKAASKQALLPPERTVASSSNTAIEVMKTSSLLADEAVAERALDAARQAGADYADVRLMLVKQEQIHVRDDHIQRVEQSDTYGLAIRVLVDGAWGFAASSQVSLREIPQLVKQAVQTGKRNALLRSQPIELVSAPIVQGTWVSPFEIDPFTISIQEKAALLLAATQAARAVRGVHHASAMMMSVWEEKLVRTSEGSRVHQRCIRVFPGLSATAIHERQRRFTTREHEIPPLQAGWEHVRDSRLVEDATLIGEQAVQKLHASPVKPGMKQVILAPSNLWLTIHESIGHSTELDRALGYEANLAGTSFLTPKMTGTYQLATPNIHFVADRTQQGGLATVAWDDEAVPAQRWDIIRKGQLVGWQTTRELAGKIGESQSRGCSYSDSFASIAMPRMPNVSLQPGPEGYTTEDLINATDDGIFILGRGSWSIDQQRRNFQFGGQFFWEINHGRLVRPLRDVAYQANTHDFWHSCDMLGGEQTYRLGGTFGDGKGEPMQSNAVSHGCPPARFRVRIMNTGGPS